MTRFRIIAGCLGLAAALVAVPRPALAADNADCPQISHTLATPPDLLPGPPVRKKFITGYGSLASAPGRCPPGAHARIFIQIKVTTDNNPGNSYWKKVGEEFGMNYDDEVPGPGMDISTQAPCFGSAGHLFRVMIEMYGETGSANPTEKPSLPEWYVCDGSMDSGFGVGTDRMHDGVGGAANAQSYQGTIPAPPANPVLAGDVSGDGFADIIARKPDGTLRYYPNNTAINPEHAPFTVGVEVGQGWNAFNRIVLGDASGDGYADLVATKLDGTLWYYPNNVNGSADHLPFGDGSKVGDGWNAFNRIVLGDVSGDGYADLLATKPDGTLWYYPNNINADPNHHPFGSGTQIGQGWNTYSRIAAGDVSGDGYADILATTSTGRLWYYPNNLNLNATGLPYSAGNEIGSGWNADNRVVPGDISGDGYADIVATKPDGSMYYYPNNFNINSNHLPYTGGVQIGSDWNQF
jgi:hypothetical protein